MLFPSEVMLPALSAVVAVINASGSVTKLEMNSDD
jgi:hypothetical protein